MEAVDFDVQPSLLPNGTAWCRVLFSSVHRAHLLLMCIPFAFIYLWGAACRGTKKKLFCFGLSFISCGECVGLPARSHAQCAHVFCFCFFCCCVLQFVRSRHAPRGRGATVFAGGCALAYQRKCIFFCWRSSGPTRETVEKLVDFLDSYSDNFDCWLGSFFGPTALRKRWTKYDTQPTECKRRTKYDTQLSKG